MNKRIGFSSTAGVLAAVALAGCTIPRGVPPVPPPTGPPVYWFVAESSQADGKIKFRCHDRNTRRCFDGTEQWAVWKEAEAMCRQWGYDGPVKPGFGTARTGREYETYEQRYRCTMKK